ncbi:MAG: hypothetical protein V5A62_16645 [Haloarculaceae archaeon]
MSSSDSPGGAEPRLVRTTGLQPSRVGETSEGEESDDAAVVDEVDRLRERVVELEAELGTVRRERDDAREWATFLDGELREHRERVETLEARVEALESRGLLGRIRGLFG